MKPEQVIDDIGNAIAERYREIERQIGQQIRKYAREAVEIPTDLTARLKAIRALKEQAWELTRNMDPDEMARVVSSIAGAHASAEIARQLLEIPALSGSTLTAGGAYAVAAAEIDLRDQLRALNERIYRLPADAYQRMTASMNGEILAGRTKWEKIHARQVEKYIADGISGFVDVSGRRWTIGAYAEMATRTAASRAWRDQSVASMASAGIDTFTPVLGYDACEQCGAWAGKVLTDGGPVGVITAQHALTGEPTAFNVDGTLQQAREAGWGHPNCRCVLIPTLPGLVRDTYTTYNEADDRARRKMRELERAVRSAKRDGTRDEIRDAQRALKAHTDEHGLRRRSYREQLRFADGKGVQATARERVRQEPRTKTPAASASKQAKKPANAWADDLPKMEKPETLAQASYSANTGAVRQPRGGYPREYWNNCSQVVNAMELRVRGFDVTAAEIAGDMGRNSFSTLSDWRDPVTGKARPPMRTNSRTRNLQKWVDEAAAGMPDGARGFMSGEWKTGGRHIFNWEKIDGRIVLFEGQIPSDASTYFARLRPSQTSFARIDDLEPAPSIRSTVQPRTEVPPVVTPETQRQYITQRIEILEDHAVDLRNPGNPFGFGNPSDDLYYLRVIYNEQASLRQWLNRLRP